MNAQDWPAGAAWLDHWQTCRRCRASIHTGDGSPSHMCERGQVLWRAVKAEITAHYP